MNTANTSIQNWNIVLSPREIGTVGNCPIFALPWVEMPKIEDPFTKKTVKAAISKPVFPKDIDIFEQAKKYYLDNKEKLLKTYQGKYIAILNNRVVGSDKDFSKLAQRVYKRFGYQTIYMPLVEKEERIAEVPTPLIKI